MFDQVDYPLSAPGLASLTQELFAAYSHANALESESFQKIKDFFADVTPDSPTINLYQSAQEFARSDIDEETIHTINSYFHLTSVAQEVRRQGVRRALTKKTMAEIKARQEGLKPLDEPLAYESYLGGGWAEWFYPTIGRHGQRRDPLVASPEELVTLIRQITPEKVFTQHPTNSNTVELNRCVAEMVAASLEITCPVDSLQSELEVAQRLTAALQNFHKTKRIPEKNFSVMDEVDLSNNATMNFLAGRKAAFEELVVLAQARFGDAFTPALQIQLADAYHAKLGDWSATDKDGNDNIKFEHRLAKLVKQRSLMTGYYHDRLLELKNAGCTDSFITTRLEHMQQIAARLDLLQSKIKAHEQPNGDIILSVAEAQRISDGINEACINGTGTNFSGLATDMISELETAFKKDPESAASYKMLSLISTLKNSGFYGYHNELRENCDFSYEVLGELLSFMPDTDYFRGFNRQHENERLAILDALIESPDDLRAAADKLIASVDPEMAESRIYKDNPRIKAYHTLQSLKLTQHHNDCFKNLVLAETKQTKDIITMLALHVATQNPRKEHWLNIVPLFEDRNGLNHFTAIILKALNFESFRHLMIAVGGKLESMFPHSDSWRVLGRIAADGWLAVTRIGEHGLSSLQNLPITWKGITVFLNPRRYDGLSLSDSSRSGGRDQSSNITDGQPKNTVQGNDQANQYNCGPSAGRIFTKDMTKAAKIMKGRVTKGDADLERVISDVASATDSSYSQRHFLKSMPRMLGHPVFNYVLNGLISNFSSRATSRGGKDGNPWAQGIQWVDLSKSRAISISTTLFYANIVNNWYVADVFERHLAEKIAGDPALQKKILEAGKNLYPDLDGHLLADDAHISAFTARTLYIISGEYRRILDKTTQGVALTDLGVSQARQVLASRKGISEKALSTKDERALYREYYAAARLGSLSFIGEEPPEAMKPPTLAGCRRLHDYVQKKVLPMEDRDYLERLSMLPFAIHDQLVSDTIAGGANSQRQRDNIILKALRMLDNALNRVRGPRLDSNDIAECGHIRKATRNEQTAPAFKRHVQMALAA